MKAIGDASVLRARGLREECGRGTGLVRAVGGVDLEVARRERHFAVMGPRWLREVDPAAPAGWAGPAHRG